jgi:biotin--protein ligase
MSLPTPIISLANYQLAGRGRTSNQWLNPTGCLMASTHFTIPTAMAQKVVFVQYLHALAIVQALDPAPAGADRDIGPLGMRIKWPNDIYAVVKTQGADGKATEEKLKMGGVLVNSNYSRGAFKITSGASVDADDAQD